MCADNCQVFLTGSPGDLGNMLRSMENKLNLVWMVLQKWTKNERDQNTTSCPRYLANDLAASSYLIHSHGFDSQPNAPIWLKTSASDSTRTCHLPLTLTTARLTPPPPHRSCQSRVCHQVKIPWGRPWLPPTNLVKAVDFNRHILRLGLSRKLFLTFRGNRTHPK